MKAALLYSPAPIRDRPLRIEDAPKPALLAGHLLLKVRACGVCRTDLHITEGELPPCKRPLIPGHQIVGDVIGGATSELPAGARVGISWIGGVWCAVSGGKGDGGGTGFGRISYIAFVSSIAAPPSIIAWWILV